MSVLIVDYGMGNIASARRSLEECGAQVIVSDCPTSASQAERIIIPGVGSFAAAMERLDERGWTDALRHAALKDRVPVLGVCLGMQLLADEGEEYGRSIGLGLIPGKVVRLKPATNAERVPHAGWNEVRFAAPGPIFHDIPSGSDFYFVHSFHFEAVHQQDVLATTDYCGGIVAAIAKGNVVGVQFHPEKSSRAGLRLLRNFLAMPC